jgi:hypothetical protein
MRYISVLLTNSPVKLVQKMAEKGKNEGKVGNVNPKNGRKRK